MDWDECVKKRIVKEITSDPHRNTGIRNIAEQKIESADYLPDSHRVSKITLLYDALRELLEAQAIEKGYKIYNHECYTAFLKEILGKTRQGDEFDRLRRIRNGINYYGTDVSQREAESILGRMRALIKEQQVR